MKKLFTAITIFSVFTLNAFAEESCGSARENVVVEIEHRYLSDFGTVYCYAKEIGHETRYDIVDCGFHDVGDMVKGIASTHWTHRNAQGAPICDFHQFIPYN